MNVGGSMARKSSSYMRLVTFKVPEAYVEFIDKLVNEGIFTSRSEAIRYAILNCIVRKYQHFTTNEETEQKEEYSYEDEIYYD